MSCIIKHFLLCGMIKILKASAQRSECRWRIGSSSEPRVTKRSKKDPIMENRKELSKHFIQC